MAAGTSIWVETEGLSREVSPCFDVQTRSEEVICCLDIECVMMNK